MSSKLSYAQLGLRVCQSNEFQRVHWEDQAHEKDELYAEFELEKAEESETEEAYGKSMFERAARRHTNRKVQRSIL